MPPKKVPVTPSPKRGRGRPPKNASSKAVSDSESSESVIVQKNAKKEVVKKEKIVKKKTSAKKSEKNEKKSEKNEKKTKNDTKTVKENAPVTGKAASATKKDSKTAEHKKTATASLKKSGSSSKRRDTSSESSSRSSESTKTSDEYSDDDYDDSEVDYDDDEDEYDDESVSDESYSSASERSRHKKHSTAVKPHDHSPQPSAEKVSTPPGPSTSSTGGMGNSGGDVVTDVTSTLIAEALAKKNKGVAKDTKDSQPQVASPKAGESTAPKLSTRGTLETQESLDLTALPDVQKPRGILGLMDDLFNYEETHDKETFGDPRSAVNDDSLPPETLTIHRRRRPLTEMEKEEREYLSHLRSVRREAQRYDRDSEDGEHDYDREDVCDDRDDRRHRGCRRKRQNSSSSGDESHRLLISGREHSRSSYKSHHDDEYDVPQGGAGHGANTLNNGTGGCAVAAGPASGCLMGLEEVIIIDGCLFQKCHRNIYSPEGMYLCHDQMWYRALGDIPSKRLYSIDGMITQLSDLNLVLIYRGQVFTNNTLDELSGRDSNNQSRSSE